jgi:hypothetical protein
MQLMCCATYVLRNVYVAENKGEEYENIFWAFPNDI